MRDCPTCGHSTPEGNFCVRCGAPLADSLERSHHRGQFAAAPAEGRYVPWLVSSLFPRLPRSSQRHFRITLGVGVALVAGLAGLRLFPVALISAALLMPLVTVLYLYDVDVYEEAPTGPILLTVGWGIAAGVGVGLLAGALAPSGPALIDRSSSAQMLTGGLVIPALGTLAMLAGPLVLLPYRRFNDALDGATFGAASAATFAAGQAIVIGAGTLAGGLRPLGAPLPWIERLLAMAIATPVLAMGALAFAGAALWLRFRAPVGDRHALGLLGRPPVAVALALLLIIAGAFTETFMATGTWLLMLAGLDAFALVLLREALHVGLLEESADRPIEAEIVCANCGSPTAVHTFCGHCGIALKALPHEPGAGSSPARPARGSSAGRLNSTGPAGRRRLLAGAGLIAVGAAVGVGVGTLAAPTGHAAPCRPGVPCGRPPIAHVLVVLGGYTRWSSSALGYSLRYQTGQWRLAGQSPAGLKLQGPAGPSALYLQGSDQPLSPTAVVTRSIGVLQDQLLGLSADSVPQDQILGPNVGLVPGSGAVFRATTATPQGPGDPVAVAVLAARSGRQIVLATVITPANQAGTQSDVLARADDVLDSLQFGP